MIQQIMCLSLHVFFCSSPNEIQVKHIIMNALRPKKWVLWNNARLLIFYRGIVVSPQLNYIHVLFYSVPGYEQLQSQLLLSSPPFVPLPPLLLSSTAATGFHCIRNGVVSMAIEWQRVRRASGNNIHIGFPFFHFLYVWI